ncbi:MAG: PRC-barrel domain-containing protein [Candidatus Pacearchaeota archaeon]|nr:PRC-barrel domain-containing protein [Candidatus Pacearchaeota archaeon]
MALKILRISEVIGMKIFTDGGDYLGTVEEANIVDNKVDGWRVRISKDSNLVALLGGARGLIIPHQYIKAFGEVIIISKAAVPVTEEKIEEAAVE